MLMHEDKLVDKAVDGDKRALEELLVSIADMVYNLSLRMLGNPHDAEDASQEIYVRIMTRLSSFRKESKFSTWVYRISINHLLNYKKSIFCNRPLSFEFYGEDIEKSIAESSEDFTEGVDKSLLADELKMSCTNVMLQCFDVQTRVIYVLGTMFQIDSKLCAEILDMTPEAYRQKLSRARKKMAGFLQEYCGLAGSKKCGCAERLNYAVLNNRLDPLNLIYTRQDVSTQYTQAMEGLDQMSLIFANLPTYRSSDIVREFLRKLIESDQFNTMRTAGGGCEY